jgi:hypothetical protein
MADRKDGLVWLNGRKTGTDGLVRPILMRQRSLIVTQLTPSELLKLHSEVSEELRTRGISRSSNSPTGDLAEYLFCKAFGWTQAGNSMANIDAIGEDGGRYQIKGRRITRHQGSRQLSALRDLAGGHFDFLAGVIFSEDYTVLRAAIIPQALVLERATFVQRTNSHRFLLRDDIWEAPGVRNVTAELRVVDL